MSCVTSLFTHSLCQTWLLPQALHLYLSSLHHPPMHFSWAFLCCQSILLGLNKQMPCALLRFVPVCLWLSAWCSKTAMLHLKGVGRLTPNADWTWPSDVKIHQNIDLNYYVHVNHSLLLIIIIKKCFTYSQNNKNQVTFNSTLRHFNSICVFLSCCMKHVCHIAVAPFILLGPHVSLSLPVVKSSANIHS